MAFLPLGTIRFELDWGDKLPLWFSDMLLNYNPPPLRLESEGRNTVSTSSTAVGSFTQPPGIHTLAHVVTETRGAERIPRYIGPPSRVTANFPNEIPHPYFCVQNHEDCGFRIEDTTDVPYRPLQACGALDLNLVSCPVAPPIPPPPVLTSLPTSIASALGTPDPYTVGDYQQISLEPSESG